MLPKIIKQKRLSEKYRTTFFFKEFPSQEQYCIFIKYHNRLPCLNLTQLITHLLPPILHLLSRNINNIPLAAEIHSRYNIKSLSYSLLHNFVFNYLFLFLNPEWIKNDTYETQNQNRSLFIN